MACMLKRFLYLDDRKLGEYVSALEGGLRSSRELKSSQGGKREGGVDLKAAKGSLERSRQDEETLTLADTSHARFERLLQLVAADPDAAGWIDIIDPQDGLADAGFGAMISVECEAYIPDVIKALASPNGIASTLDQMETLLPFAKVFDLSTEGLPGKEQRDAMKGFAQVLAGKLVVIGEIDDSEWHIAGQLDPAHIQDHDIEGRVIIVGKISTKWEKGKWKALLALPGTSLLPRTQRRALERKRPDSDQEEQYLEGPAAMVEILAIYR